MCEDYRIENKVKRVTRYMDSQYADYMKTMEEYDTGDWEALRKMLLKEFKKYASQGESARVGSVGIKDLDTEPLRPIYYTSETPKARIIINS